MIRITTTCLALGLSSAACAWVPGDHIPAPSDAALFAVAVAALVIGRQASKRPPRAK